jgi:hypothetical protein
LTVGDGRASMVRTAFLTLCYYIASQATNASSTNRTPKSLVAKTSTYPPSTAPSALPSPTQKGEKKAPPPVSATQTERTVV